MSSELDPCSPETTANECANAWCDDRLADLPKRQRVRLIAKEPGGRCFVEFPTGAKGFVVADGDGFTVTEAPCVEIPIANTYATDPTTGAVLYDDCGDPIRQAHPGWENIIITGEDGCQNRLGGLDGIPADLHWDGTKFILKPTEELETQVPLSNYEAFDGDCKTYDAVFRVDEVCSPTQGLMSVATLGYRPSPRIPCGSIMLFGGPDATIPDGWLKCDGSSLPQADYPCLYSAIGVNFGGVGTNFNVPDLRRRIPLGIDAADSDGPEIGLGDTFASLGGQSGDGTFLSNYQSLSVSTRNSLDTITHVGSSIPTTFDSIPLGITEYSNNITFTPPVGATHIVLNSWLLVASNINGHSTRATIKIEAPYYVPESPDGPPDIRINAAYAGVDTVEPQGFTSEGVGGRYDIPIRAGGAAVTEAEAIPTTWGFKLVFIESVPMISYYAYEIFQQGFRMAATNASGAELFGMNYIIYAGASASCTNA